MSFLDRLQTILATATLTSAAWILVGTIVLGEEERGPSGEAAEPARSTPRPAPTSEDSAAPGERLAIPVAGVSADQLTDSFADTRGGRRHEAIDIMAPAGTPVLAAGPGTVEKLFLSDAGGNTIYVRSGDRRTIHYYAHLQAYAQGLAEGQTVRRGQQLGTVGSTGNADVAAPHLHFAVLRTDPAANWWEDAAAIDPYRLMVR